MNVLVIIGHQHKGSFCHALAEAVVAEAEAAGGKVVFHDLYEDNFDPILTQDEIFGGGELDATVKRHCDELLWADLIVVVHPNWWGQPPAMLKGWIDRVFRQGTIYHFGEGGKIIGHLQGKTALVFTTSNTPREVELASYGDPLQNLWENCVFKFCGVERFQRRNFESVIMSTLEERKQWLAELREIVKQNLDMKIFG